MTKDLTRGTPWKLILQFALPIMAGNLLQQLYNTADTIIVGNFNGQQALSAVGACASLTVLFTALAIGFSIGAGVLISQYFGASRERELRQYAATAIVLMLAMGLFMSLAGVVSARFLLERVLGTPEALLPMTLLYFRIYAAGLVFQFGYNIAAALLRALGDSKATLYFLLVSSILNVVLDLAFVAGLGLGVAGAAVATVISQIASCVIGFAYMHRKYALLRFSLRELRLDVKTAGRILQVGAPMAIQQSIVSCGFLFLQRLVNLYGESMIASYTVATRMENILMIPILGVQNTMATFAGQNMGAQRPDRVSRGLGQGVLVSLSMTLPVPDLRHFAHHPRVPAGRGRCGHLPPASVQLRRRDTHFRGLFSRQRDVPGRGRGLPRHVLCAAGAGAARDLCLCAAQHGSVRLYRRLVEPGHGVDRDAPCLLCARVPRQMEEQISDLIGRHCDAAPLFCAYFPYALHWPLGPHAQYV